MALSQTSREIPSRATQAEINALSTEEIQPGSSIYNTTTEKMNTSLEGGLNALWTENIVSDENSITVSSFSYPTKLNLISEAGPLPSVSSFQVYSNGFLAYPNIMLSRGKGTKDAPLEVEDGDSVGGMSFCGITTNGTLADGININVNVDGVVTSTQVPMSYTISTQDNDSSTKCLTKIGSNGKMLIQATGAGSEFRVESSSLSLDNTDINIEGDNLNFTGDILGPTYSPKITMRVIADEAIPVNAILTASTTDFRVRQITPIDADGTPVIGFSLSSAAAAGDEIIISGASVETVQMDAISTCSPGNPIEKSDTTLGRVQTSVISVGTFGIAAQSAIQNAVFKVWVRRSEQF